MTADGRVTRWVARWFMRAETSGKILRIVFFGLTGLSTALFTLKQYGYDEYAWEFTAALVGGTIAFMYLYDTLGILNQKNRDRNDRSTNFSGPNMRMDDELIGCAVFAAVHGRPPDEDERETIAEAVHEPWAEFRDGVVLEAADD